MGLYSVLISIVVVVLLCYYYVRRKFNYWGDRNIPFVKPEFPFGNVRGIGVSVNNGQMLKKFYQELKHQDVIGGLYYFLKPAVLITNLDLLRNVFIKDFQYFPDRGVFHNGKDDPLSAHLFAIEGKYWKTLRTKLSPTFTSARMKMMHSTMLKVADQLKDYLTPLAETKSEIEVKEVLGQFTTDIIGNAAFGIECNSMSDPNNGFRVNGRKIFDLKPLEILKLVFMNTFPNFGRRMGMCFNKPEVAEFFMRILKETVDYREQNQINRNDFLSLLLQLKNKGKLDDEDTNLGTLTFNELAAQMFVFFAGGFETSSSTMAFALYELAINQEVQQKAREEVQAVLENHNGILNYEAASSLTYLDQVINETLRKYPVVDTLQRIVENDYKVPNTNHVIEKGTTVQIPIYGIHTDPEIYPQPEKFDPERFTPENIAARHPFAWIPFGEGPRVCIGMRFGMMQTRVGLATILSNFVLKPTENTPIPMEFAPSSLMMSSKGGMFIQFESL